MKATRVILGRELRSFFLSPMTYVVAFFFVLVRGFDVNYMVRYFATYKLDTDNFPLNFTTTRGAQVMCILVPAILTMRLFSEEKRTGSMELLMTAPVSDASVTIAKWLAALVFYLVLWLPSLILLFLVQSSWLLDHSFPLGTIISVHLWVLLAGGLFLAIGLFCSSLSQNQLISSLLAIVMTFMIFFGPHMLARELSLAKEGFGAALFEQAYILNHIVGSFGMGLIDSSQIWFYLSATAAFLFLTARSLEARKWV